MYSVLNCCHNLQAKKTYSVQILLSDDSLRAKSQSEGRKDGKIKFMGGQLRLDDDQSDCADDITRLCPEIPKGNNFALLVCLQDKAKVCFASVIILAGQNKILLDFTKNKRLNFIHCCQKMIYDQKIVRTSCPTTLGILSDMSNFWLANVQHLTDMLFAALHMYVASTVMVRILTHQVLF